jgi:RNA polymerase sigma factor (TIGR02999 family)
MVGSGHADRPTGSPKPVGAARTGLNDLQGRPPQRGQSMADAGQSGRLTEILESICAGDVGRQEEFFALVYQELLAMARRQMDCEKPGQTLQPTALVHEAYLRLMGGAGQDCPWENRAHFFGAAAEAMRRILVENARRKAAVKHGGGRHRVSFGAIDLAEGRVEDDEALPAIDEALSRLEACDGRMAAIVKLRYFAGLSVEETARALGVSDRTVNRDWVAARAWLRREVLLHPGQEQEPDVP